MVTMLSCMSIFIILPTNSHAKEKSINLSVGDVILYPPEWRNGIAWGTPIFIMEGSHAYCGKSSFPAPAGGNYTAYQVGGENENLIKALYRGFGGPASVFVYDKSVKALNLEAAEQYALTHLIVSTIYSGDQYGFNDTGYPHVIYQTVFDAITKKPLPKYLEYEAYKISGESVYQDILGMTSAKLIVPTGNITLNKRDSEKGSVLRAGATVEGAEYTLYAAENIYGGFEGRIVYRQNDIISKQTLSTGQVFGDSGTKKVDDSGTIIWDNLPEGKYYIKETKAAKGFNINDEIYSATLTDVGGTIISPEVNATDEIITFNLTIEKTLQKPEYEEDDIPVKKGKGCVFEIKGASGEVEKEVITDGNGKVVINDLVYDDYDIKEIRIPEDYEKDGYACELSWHINKGEITQGKTFNFKGENRLKTGKMAITKIANDSNLVIARAGTEFELYNWRHELIKMKNKNVLVTDSRGICIVPYNMPIGVYYLKEKKAPKGYSLNHEEVVFTLKEEKGSAINFYDDPQKFIVKFTKVGSDNKIISGARFEIKAAEVIKTEDGVIRAKKDEKVCEMVSDLNGNVVSANLYPGKYILTELETSKGYKLLEDNLLINVEEIDQKESIHEINLGKIVNEYIPVNEEVEKEVTKAPKTGDKNYTICIIILASIFVAFGVFAVILLKKMKRKHHRR